MKNKSINGYKAEKVVGVLIADIEDIRNVQSWAESACVSTDWLRKILGKAYEKTPKSILREVRFELIVHLIEERGWEAGGDGIAIDSGVGESCKALHQFLKNHYSITFTGLKEEVLTGEREVSFMWLNGRE